MPRSPTEIERPGIPPRLNPLALRKSLPYFGSESDSVKPAKPESAIVTVRKSFWECDAEYNPLGKFGASFSRV